MHKTRDANWSNLPIHKTRDANRSNLGRKHGGSGPTLFNRLDMDTKQNLFVIPGSSTDLKINGYSFLSLSEIR